MTFNWGYKLMLVFLAFSVMMGYLVYKCVNTKFDLVSKDYYKDELAYQEVIDASKNAASLSSPVKLERQNGTISLIFPAETRNTEISGSVWFYCAANGDNDKKLKFDLQPGKKFQMQQSQLQRGNYAVKITWSADKHQYYSEENLIIP